MSERPILVLCETCQSEGRILRSRGGPDDIDCGECPACEGAGLLLVDSEPAGPDVPFVPKAFAGSGEE